MEVGLTGTKLCSAINGDWKFGPTPMPAMIWKMIILAQEECTPRSMKEPKPASMKTMPNHMHGRYWPVLRMKTPVNADKKDRERAVGSR